MYVHGMAEKIMDRDMLAAEAEQGKKNAMLLKGMKKKTRFNVGDEDMSYLS